MAGTERNVSIIIKAKNEADKALASLGKNLTSLPILAAASTAALAAIGAVMAKVTMAAAEQEKADVRLATALASVGQNTAPVRARLNEFISTLENVTTVGDETISGVVATFAQLGQLTGNALEDATKAALDYAAATGQDVQSAATQMVNVLVKGSGRLQGIATDFDATASKGDRFAQVIGQINDKMGGSAAITGKTFSGAIQRIANDYDNLMQETGRAVVENEAFRGVLEAVSVILKEATGFVADHSDAFQTLVTVLSRAALGFVKIAAEVTSFEFRIISMGLSIGQVAVGLASLADDAPALVKKAFGWTDKDSIDLAKWAGQWMTRLGDIKGAFGEAGDAADVVAAKIENIISGLGKGNGKTQVPPAIHNVGTGAAAAKTEVEQLAELMKSLGIPTMNDFETSALGVDNALKLLQDLASKGLISPEQWDAALAAITQITEQLPTWSDSFAQAEPRFIHIRSLTDEIGDAIQNNLVDATLQFGDALIDTALGARIAWGQFFRQLLRDLLSAIARILIMRALLNAIGGIGRGGPAVTGPAAGGGGVLTGNGLIAESSHAFAPVQFASPSVAGGAIGAGGLSADSLASAGVAPSPTFALNATIVPRRDRMAEAAEVLADINTLVERRGYRLLASQVLV